MIRILGMLMILMLAMATISIDYSFAQKPISYNRFKATKDQMEEGTPITIHGEAWKIPSGQLLSRKKLTTVNFIPIDEDGDRVDGWFPANFLASDNEFIIRRRFGGGTQRFNPYDPTMLDRILDFIENDTNVKIRGHKKINR